MSAYSTLDITREEAIRMIRAVRAKNEVDPLVTMTNEQLDEELHEYVYSEAHTDIVGLLHNYRIL